MKVTDGVGRLLAGLRMEELCGNVHHLVPVAGLFRITIKLRGLGFVPEGYARDYLFIDGAWRDHIMTALTNPAPMAPG